MGRIEPRGMGLALAASLGCWALVAGIPAGSQAPSGADLYAANCAGCHELYDPERPRRSRAEWDGVIQRMIDEKGAALSPRERAAVLSYLDSFNRPPREIRWQERPAAARSIRFEAREEAPAPPEWVELTLGDPDAIPWAVQPSGMGEPGGIGPLRPAAQGLLPALLDNSGVVTAGTLRTRVLAGESGGGILFGYRSPQSHFGVRVGPREVILFETRGDRRARLARAARETPRDAWVTLTVELRGERGDEVRVRVDDQELPALTRTLAGYRGGWTGLHAGSPAVRFDRWEVSVP